MQRYSEIKIIDMAVRFIEKKLLAELLLGTIFSVVFVRLFVYSKFFYLSAWGLCMMSLMILGFVPPRFKGIRIFQISVFIALLISMFAIPLLTD